MRRWPVVVVVNGVPHIELPTLNRRISVDVLELLVSASLATSSALADMEREVELTQMYLDGIAKDGGRVYEVESCVHQIRIYVDRARRQHDVVAALWASA
jgi:hypothetical protein